MSLVALCADKGSPGVTTAALALAAAWPGRAALAELDPAGGDLGFRLTDHAGYPRLRPEPSLLTLAAAVRRGAGPDQVWAHCQPGAGGLPVLLGLTVAEQGSGLSTLWPGLVRVLRDAPDGDLLADLGRLHPGSPVLPVAAAADQVVCVARATSEGLVRVRDRLTHLLPALPPAGEPGGAARRPRTAVLMIAEDRIGDAAVAAARTVLDHAGLPVDVLGFLAVDPRAVVELQTGQRGARVDRSLLMRTGRALADRLSRRLTGAERSPASPARAAGRAGVAGEW